MDSCLCTRIVACLSAGKWRRHPGVAPTSGASSSASHFEDRCISGFGSCVYRVSCVCCSTRVCIVGANHSRISSEISSVYRSHHFWG
eukprot:6487974-Amphidinium_carterae.2